MIKRVLAVIAASIALVSGSVVAAEASYPPATQTGAVSATVVAPGGKVSFAGSGFASGSTVQVSVNSAAYTTVVAGGSSSSALAGPTTVHFSDAAYAVGADVVAAQPASASFSVSVTLQKSGSNLLMGTGVAPDGTAHVVTATVIVSAGKVTATSSGSGLPFTGSEVIIPGVIVGAAMLAGGFLLLTSVRSRKAGARS